MNTSPELVGTHIRRIPTAPVCPQCGAAVVRDHLAQPVTRQVSRVGAPLRPRPPLPTWRCLDCGCVQPRIE